MWLRWCLLLASRPGPSHGILCVPSRRLVARASYSQWTLSNALGGGEQPIGSMTQARLVHEGDEPFGALPVGFVGGPKGGKQDVFLHGDPVEQGDE